MRAQSIINYPATASVRLRSPPGTAQSLCDYLLPFMIQSDTAPLVVVGGAGSAKTLSCLSNLACDSTRTSGLTELTLEGHDVTAKVKDWVQKKVTVV